MCTHGDLKYRPSRRDLTSETGGLKNVNVTSSTDMECDLSSPFLRLIHLSLRSLCLQNYPQSRTRDKM